MSQSVIVFVPGSGRIVFPTLLCALLPGRNEVSSPALLRELLVRPGIVRVRAQDVVDSGCMSAADVRALGHEVNEPGQVESVVPVVPEPLLAAPLQQVERVSTVFSQMRDNELNAYAEEHGVLLKEKWSRDRKVFVLQEHEKNERV